MLDIIILKVIHTGEREAKKLLPYILECDIFSNESIGSSEKYAKLAERNWERTLKLTRSKFKKLQRNAYNRRSQEEK